MPHPQERTTDERAPGAAARRLALAVVLVLVFGALLHAGEADRRLLDLVAWIRGAGWPGVLAFAVAYVVATVLFLPGSVLTLGAGFAYGVGFGTAVVTVAANTGALRAFLLGRTAAREVDRAVLEGDAEGFLRVHLQQGSDRILGATLVASRAGDMIPELTVAMAAGRGLATVGAAIHPYPTQAEVMKKAADAYNRTRLTPRVRWLFERLLAARR